MPLGKSRLHDLLETKLPLVLDAVWERQDAEAFDVLGPRCRMLIATRDGALITALRGTHHGVELLTDREASLLLPSRRAC
jgi:hypothetical protein